MDIDNNTNNNNRDSVQEKAKPHNNDRLIIK